MGADIVSFDPRCYSTPLLT